MCTCTQAEYLSSKTRDLKTQNFRSRLSPALYLHSRHGDEALQELSVSERPTHWPSPSEIHSTPGENCRCYHDNTDTQDSSQMQQPPAGAGEDSASVCLNQNICEHMRVLCLCLQGIFYSSLNGPGTFGNLPVGSFGNPFPQVWSP